MTVNWLEDSVTVIHFPWVDLRFPRPSTPCLPGDLHFAQDPSLLRCLPQVHAVDISAGSSSGDYIAFSLIIASSSLFILWQYIIKSVTSEEMKCQCELQARAEAGCKSTGRAKKVFLLIAHILHGSRGFLSLCNRMADCE